METHQNCILCHCHITSTPVTSDSYLGSFGCGRTNTKTGLEANGNGNEEIQLISSFYSRIQISGFAAGKLDTFLEGDDDDDDEGTGRGYHGKLSICGKCRPVILTTIERKQVLDEVDENVRKLQLELLRELNKLKVLVHQFYNDMKGVEERIGGSRDQSQYALWSQWNACKVDLFERRIRKVIKDLSWCQVNGIPETRRQDVLENPIIDYLIKQSPPSSPSSPPPQSCQESDDDSIQPSPTGKNSPDPFNQIGDQVSHDMYPNYDKNSATDQKSPKTGFTSRNSTSRNQKSDFNSLNSSYHPCKTYVISKVLHRKEQILSGKPLPKKPSAKTDVEDPRDAYYIDYDPTTDSFSVDGLPIALTVTSQHSFHFTCSQCSFLTGQKKKKTKSVGPFLEILDHVLHLHRQIFQCSSCARSCYDITSYREHMRGHQMKYVCDICGKPLQTSKNLKTHKWLHLNEQEREQAMKEGAKDPRLLRNKIDGTIFPCSTCGKGFNRRGNLKIHQETHLTAEERRKICDKCGKECFCYASWLEHWKHCTAGEDVNFPKTIQCTKCTNTFTSVNGLKMHLRRNHPGEGKEKRVTCETCGKGFWTMGELRNHMSTHGDERPFECGKGCGMRFKTRTTWRHHQKCCDGSGTRPGPKNGKRKKKNEVK